MLAFCYFGASTQTLALPEWDPDNAVKSGNAIISSDGSNQITVDQTSNKAIIDWDSFNLSQSESIYFMQPGSHSAVLNRILDQNPSEILGSIFANGQVFLLNPNGIIFGENAQIQVNSLFAGTHDISDNDFLDGYYYFSSTSSASGEVSNYGDIYSNSGGFVVLAGDIVENHGEIHSPDGRVGLIAGREMALDLDGSGLLHVSITQEVINTANDSQAVYNTGLIEARHGTVSLQAKVANEAFINAINNEGVVQADWSLSSTPNGVIQLLAEGGDTAHSGALISNGDSYGGTVSVLGDRVALLGQSTIDVSADGSGGDVFIGGGQRGNNPEIKNAQVTYVSPNSVINADSNGQGEGGGIYIWSDDTTRFLGYASAIGGIGNGGVIETASRQNLLVNGSVDTSSKLRDLGSWLIGAEQIDVVEQPIMDSAVWTPMSSGSSVVSSSLLEQALENTEVSLKSNSDINVTDSIDYYGPSSYLGFEAGRKLTIDEDIISNNSPLSLVLQGNNPDGNAVEIHGQVFSNGSNIDLFAEHGDIVSSENSSIVTEGGGIVPRLDNGALDLSSGTHQIDILGAASSPDMYAEGLSLKNYGDLELRGHLRVSNGDVNIELDDGDFHIKSVLSVSDGDLNIDLGDGYLHAEGPIASSTNNFAISADDFDNNITLKAGGLFLDSYIYALGDVNIDVGDGVFDNHNEIWANNDIHINAGDYRQESENYSFLGGYGATTISSNTFFNTGHIETGQGPLTLISKDNVDVSIGGNGEETEHYTLSADELSQLSTSELSIIAHGDTTIYDLSTLSLNDDKLSITTKGEGADIHWSLPVDETVTFDTVLLHAEQGSNTIASQLNVVDQLTMVAGESNIINAPINAGKVAIISEDGGIQVNDDGALMAGEVELTSAWSDIGSADAPITVDSATTTHYLLGGDDLQAFIDTDPESQLGDAQSYLSSVAQHYVPFEPVEPPTEPSQPVESPQPTESVQLGQATQKPSQLFEREFDQVVERMKRNDRDNLASYENVDYSHENGRVFFEDFGQKVVADSDYSYEEMPKQIDDEQDAS